MTSPNTLIADMQSEIDSVRLQLAAAQARILELRKVINDECLSIAHFGDQPPQYFLDVLATPDDDTAIRKLVAKHVRAVSPKNYKWAENYAEGIENWSEPL